MSPDESFKRAIHKIRGYGLGEFLEIVSELSQESTKKGVLNRLTKELITLGLALSKHCKRCIDIHTAEARRLGASADDLNQVRKIVLFLNAAPWHDDLMWDSWESSWREFSLARGPIQHHVRELIALAIGIQRQHEGQLCLHAREALKFGAKPEELIELLPLVLLMDGAPALSQIPLVVRAIERYEQTQADARSQAR